MTRWMLRGGVLALAGASLAACGGGNNSSTAVATTTTTTTPTAPASIPSMFGANFATDYAAPANSTPTKVASGDINALSLTTAPIAVK